MKLQLRTDLPQQGTVNTLMPATLSRGSGKGMIRVPCINEQLLPFGLLEEFSQGWHVSEVFRTMHGSGQCVIRYLERTLTRSRNAEGKQLLVHLVPLTCRRCHCLLLWSAAPFI